MATGVAKLLSGTVWGMGGCAVIGVRARISVYCIGNFPLVVVFGERFTFAMSHVAAGRPRPPPLA